jgi:hypothetical protein
MQDRPDPEELLRTVAATLRERLMPQLTGEFAFEARVAANAIDLVVRQLALQPAADTSERQRLAALLGRDGALDELNRELCARIADGRLTQDDPALAAHLWATTLDKLAVDQPTYAAYRAEAGEGAAKQTTDT